MHKLMSADEGEIKSMERGRETKTRNGYKRTSYSRQMWGKGTDAPVAA